MVATAARLPVIHILRSTFLHFFLSSLEEPMEDELLEDERFSFRPPVDLARPRFFADTLERGGREPSESEASRPRYATTLRSSRPSRRSEPILSTELVLRSSCRLLLELLRGTTSTISSSDATSDRFLRTRPRSSG